MQNIYQLEIKIVDITRYSKALDQTTQEVIQFAKTCSSSQLSFKPEGWSIFEVLEHIHITDKIIHKIVLKSTEKMSPLDEIIGDSKLKRTIAENRDTKIKAPDAVKPKGDIQDVDTFERLLLEHRGLLKRDLESGKITIDNRILRHFYLGEMTISDWLNLIVHHTRRHIKQMEEIIALEKEA